MVQNCLGSVFLFVADIGSILGAPTRQARGAPIYFHG